VMYESQAEVDRVAAAYANDAAMLRELETLSAQKRAFTNEPVSRLAALRPELGDAAAWRIGELPFAVIAAHDGAAAHDGTAPRAGAVYDAPDGTRFAVAAAATRAEADMAAAALGTGARVLRVRPAWSKPADTWRAANSALWAER
jgi:hypothetical protein